MKKETGKDENSSNVTEISNSQEVDSENATSPEASLKTEDFKSTGYLLYKSKAEDRRKLIYLASFFFLLIVTLISVSLVNPTIYIISKETISFINEAFNAAVFLIIPFIFGSIGALTRVLMSGVTMSKSISLILSSGLMGMFSWIGIKSGILLSMIAPHINESALIVSNIEKNPQNEFYSMALVAIIVGMFSSNVYIFINQKVEQLTAKNTAKNQTSGESK